METAAREKPGHARAVPWLSGAAVGTVAGLAWLAYSPILGAYFRHDDFWWLSTAQRWAAGTLPVTHAPAGVAPIYSLLYHVTHLAWGLDPRPYFAQLLLCHAVNSCLVAILVWMVTGRLAQGWLSGLFFAVLFTHHEAVTWPAAGPHVFVTLGILPATICWVQYRRGVRWCLPGSVLLGSLAVMTKDSGVTVVPLLLAVDLTLFRRTEKRTLVWLAVPLLVLVTWRVLLPPLMEPMTPGSAAYRVGAHMGANLVRIVPQMVVPDLRFENYRRLLEQALPARAVGAVVRAADAAVVLLTVVALWGLWRGSAPVRMGVLWCYVAFVPFLPFSYEYARAPRYLYISSVGLAVVVGWLVGRAWTGPPGRATAGRALLVAAVVAYVAGSVGFARMVCANRLRDSETRRMIISTVIRHVGGEPPGTAIHVQGLPPAFSDVAQAVALHYSRPVTVVADAGPAPAGRHVFRFDTAPPHRLIEYRPGRATPVPP